MTLQQIKSFIMVIELGSFNKAEEAFPYTKQALKRHIDLLEEELQFKLIIRTAKGVRLTPAGRIFYEAIKDGTNRLDTLIRQCRAVSDTNMQLCIGVPLHSKMLLEDAISAYADRYPDIHLDVRFVHYQFHQKVLNRELDIAEVIYRPELMLNGLSYKNLCVMRYNCVVAASHPLACRKEIYPDDLLQYPIGINQRADVELYKYLYEHYQGIILRNITEQNVVNVMNICYNQGVYISKAYSVHHMEPLVTIPFHVPFEFECGVIYRTDSVCSNVPTPITDFLNLLDEIY